MSLETSTGPAVPRWSWVLVLGVGLALFLAVEQTLVRTGNPNFVPSTLLLGALLAPATFVTYVYARAGTWSVPLSLLAAAAVLGGVVGTVTAGTLEYDSLRRLGAVPTLLVGLIEEGAKLAVPLALLLTTRHRRPGQGLVIGVAVGAGFAALETMGYGFVELLRSNGDLGAVQELLLLRGVLSPAGHMAWTGLTCAALYRAWDARGRDGTAVRAAGTFVLVVVLHGLWDGLGSLPAYLVLGVVSLGLLRRELHREVLAEVTSGAGRPAGPGTARA